MSRNLRSVLLGSLVLVAFFARSFSAEKSITVPTGTRTITLGPGHYKFILRDQFVEVTGLDPGNGSFSYLAVISKSSPPRLWGGKQGRMVSAAKAYRRVERQVKQLLPPSTDMPLRSTWNVVTVSTPPLTGNERLRRGVRHHRVGLAIDDAAGGTAIDRIHRPAAKL